jgi:hypothetical protein
MTQARRFPRRDPLLLFRLQTDFAAGLAPAQIAEKHALSLYIVTQALRRDGNGRLPDPYVLSRREREGGDATLLYWIGYIAACGSVFDGPNPTLVLDIDTDDLAHVHTLVEDLCDGRPGLESCQSSTRGLQVYIRDRNLGRLLVRWGIPGGDRATEAVPVEFIPHGLVSHFFRGYIEGGRETPPFGAGRVPGSPKAVRRVVLTGPHDFLTALKGLLPPDLRRAGTISGRAPGPARLTYDGESAGDLLRFAYKDAARSLPRAAALQRAFAPAHRV